MTTAYFKCVPSAKAADADAESEQCSSEEDLLSEGMSGMDEMTSLSALSSCLKTPVAWPSVDKPCNTVT